MLGILGGMGPAATVDLMRQIVAHTPAKSDEDHIPLVVCSDPRVPSIADAIFRGGDSPVPAMVRGIRTLEAGGAECIAVACHAAYHWYDDLVAASRIPIIHIADAVGQALAQRALSSASVGVMAAGATLRSGFYTRKLAQIGYSSVLLSNISNESLVFPAIKLVKQGRANEAAPMFRTAIAQLRAAGASSVILACTEIPIALGLEPAPEDADCIDGTAALAGCCVAWWQERNRTSARAAQR